MERFWEFSFFSVRQSKASKTRTPPSQTSKSTPKSQKISPSKGNSRSPHTPSPSKTGQIHGGTPSGRGSGHMARRGLGLSSSASSSSAPGSSCPSTTGDDTSLLWVDKYRPRSLKTVIGQQGDQSCANKLLHWLRNWHKHHGGGASSKPPGINVTATEQKTEFLLLCEVHHISFSLQ